MRACVCPYTVLIALSAEGEIGGSIDRFLLSSPPFCENVLHVGPSPSYRNLSPGCLSVSSLMCLLIISVVVKATYDRSYGVREGFFFF